MIKKYWPVLVLSVLCLSACSKKEGVDMQTEDTSPVMAVVNETPATESQEPMRDPLKNILTDTSAGIQNNASASAIPQQQNLAGDIPPADVLQAAPAAKDAHFANPMDRVVTNGNAVAMAPDNSNVTRAPAGGYSATATAPTLKDAAAGYGRPVQTNR